MDDPQSGTAAPSSFLQAWGEYVAASQIILERLKNPAAGGASIPLPFFGAWQQFAQSMGLNAALLGGGGLNSQDPLANAAPALGLTREYQTIVQRMTALGAEFQRRYTEFLAQSAGITEQALHAVQRRAGAEPHLTASPAAAYDAWIDSAEAAYAQIAHGDAFAQSVGELCNLLSAFKVERGKLLEAFAKHLDLPSRAEVDSLHRKVQDLARAATAAAAPAARKTRPRTARKPPRK